MNKILLDGIWYYLINVDAPKFWIYCDEKYPSPFIRTGLHTGGKMSYQSIRIGDKFYGFKKIEINDKKPNGVSLSDEIFEKYKWNFMDVFGVERRFTKHFTGSSWFQLSFNKEYNILTIDHRYKNGEMVKVLFDGRCYNEETFKTLCELLEIK